MFRQPWSAALAGVFAIGVGITIAVRNQDRLTPWVWVGLGAFVVLGAIVARVKTGTWHQLQVDDDSE
jgi:hypothetical protein